MRKDVFGLLKESVANHGDIVRFKIGPVTTHVINHPDMIHHVLVKNRENYNKDSLSTKNIRFICGEALLTSNAEEWRWRRDVLNPLFMRSNVDSFLNIIRRRATLMLDDWEKRLGGCPEINVSSEMMKLTFGIIGEYLFDKLFDSHVEPIEQAVHDLVTITYKRWGRLINFPASVPTRENRRFSSSLNQIDQLLDKILTEYDLSGANRNTLIDVLRSGFRNKCGTELSRDQLRNEAMAFLIAGHETTAHGLAWSLYHTCKNRYIMDQIAEEAASLRCSGSLKMADLESLKHTKCCFLESIRLSPPIWAMERHAISHDTIAGFHIPARSSVVISPYMLHRHPGFWENPEAYQPCRFSESSSHHAYMPFGLGQRFCIGRELAMAEGQIILAMIHERFDAELLSERVIEEPAISLRIKGGLMLKLSPRS